MASRLAKHQHNLTRELIVAGTYNDNDIAIATHCSKCTIRRHRRNMRVFGSTFGLPNQGGRNPVLTKPMVAALVDHLLEKPELYLDEMAWFLFDEFSVTVSTSTISRALHQAGWSKKQVSCSLLHTAERVLL
jgi:transposase